ncbi:LysM peptidoglycan-binding domain-containing protein [Marinospirillum sp.]|uniref:LysM peptidoglycan-binding domain-containing protein n=1 Tax=Marinospirillum sp. TaxID=2183934 RepID=UPI003A841B3A
MQLMPQADISHQFARMQARLGQFLLLLLFSGLLVGQLRAEALVIREDAPRVYEVKRGDSLWAIAERFLDDPWMWPQIWHANPGVANPHLIYPGDIIELLDRENRLRLRPRLRLLTLQEPIPFLPLDQIQAFINGDIMIDRPEFEDALYIVGFDDARTLGANGDRVHVLGEVTSDERYYTVYRHLEQLRDPETRQALGFKARAIGTARMVQAGSTSVLELVDTSQEIRVGDRLLPFAPSSFTEGLQPQLPAQPTHGRVLRALNPDIQRIGSFEPVILSGGQDQLRPGQMFEVLAPGRRLRHPQTGEVVFAADRVRGTVMVYRVFDQVSFALVMQSKEPIQPGDDFRQASRLPHLR